MGECDKAAGAYYSPVSEDYPRRTVRVVHVVVAGEVGGAERMLVDLASPRTGSEVQHTIALFTPSEALRRLLADAGLHVVDHGRAAEHALAFLRRSLGVRDVRRLTSLLCNTRADIVHLHTIGSHVLGTRAAIRAGCKIVRTEHSTRAYTDRTVRPFSRWSLNRCNAAVAISEHLREVCTRDAPLLANRVRVIRNGVDDTHFRHVSIGAATPATFAWVGRLEPRKNVHAALEAVQLLEGVRLDIVGDGPERLAAEQAAKALGIANRVTFHGYQADVRPIVQSAMFGLSTSREEGLGIGLLEMMALGRPVVAPAVGGIPEIVREGTSGVLTPTCSAEDIRRGMATLLERTPAQVEALSASARQFVLQHASVRGMCMQYEATYREVLERPSPT